MLCICFNITPTCTVQKDVATLVWQLLYLHVVTPATETKTQTDIPENILNPPPAPMEDFLVLMLDPYNS